MFIRFIGYYIDSYKGLRKEVWLLTLVTMVNRAGTMVFPFIAIYLKDDLDYSYNQISILMACFGGGSLAGGWLGGKLTDRIGFYQVMFLSLFISGFQFIALQFITEFYMLCIALFFLEVVADSFRPAAFVAITTYSKAENRTRSISLFRLAINLGFIIGPALGGYFIKKVGYNLIFWIDGITCILSSLMFILLLDKKQSRNDENNAKSTMLLSPYKDGLYLFFLVILVLIGSSFFQLFSTIPLYFKEMLLLTEDKIGLLMMLSGIIIVICEMPVIKRIEETRISIYKILAFSTLFIAASFYILNSSTAIVIAISCIVLLTVGELINFPFLNRFAIDCSMRGRQGEYMSLFTMTFSFSHMVGTYAGVQFVNHFGYRITWYIFTGVLMISAILFLILGNYMKKRENQ